jgi:hypothetical protein
MARYIDDAGKDQAITENQLIELMGRYLDINEYTRLQYQC